MISPTLADTDWSRGGDAFGYAWRWPGYALFFLMLFVPTTYQPIKGVLLAGTLAAVALGALSRGRIALHPQVLTLTLGFMALGSFFIARGLVEAAPGALRMSTVYILWPAVYTLLIAGAADIVILRTLFRLMIWATIAVAAYSLIFVLWSLGVWPNALYISLDQGQALGLYGNYVEFNLYSISSLLFLVPFALSALLVTPAGREAPVARRTIWVALGLGLLTTLLTGRRALLVVMAMSPLIGLVFWACMPHIARRITRKMVRRSVVGALVMGVLLSIYLQTAYGLTFSGLVRMISTGFQFGTDPVARLRADQYHALMEGWQAQPWLGSGHGMPAPGVIRSHEMPWAYELSYLSLMYHTGLVGLLAYVGGVFWTFWLGLRIVRSGDPLGRLVLPVLVGTSTFLIANATNPYLEKYDYLWVVFLPVAFINYSLLVQRRTDA
jgi:hypothetical protein